MRRWIYAFFVGGILGTAFGVAVGFFIFPYVFPPPPAMEMLAADEQADVIATGTFIHANTLDPIHYGGGNVTVYEKLVFLEEDFEVGPGPAFHVYLAPNAQIRTSSDVKGTMYIDLGKLRAFRGSQKLPYSRRCRPEKLSEHCHLVRRVWRLDLTCRSSVRVLT